MSFDSSGRACAAVLAALLAVAVAGCGKSGRGAETDPEKGSDAALLNGALVREMTLRTAYDRGVPLLPGRLRAVGRRLRAQEAEYADALTKAIRGVGGEIEAEAEAIAPSAVGARAAFLDLAYELESASLAAYVDASPHLYTAAPRALDASLAAAHAQHLVVLRQALGAGLSDSIPKAFDGGQVPPPPGGG